MKSEFKRKVLEQTRVERTNIENFERGQKPCKPLGRASKIDKELKCL